MDIPEQSPFIKLSFFIASVCFLGLFVSLPTSVAIVAMIHLNCIAHCIVRETLGVKTHGVLHLPIFGALSLYSGFVLHERDKTIIAMAGPIAGFVCSFIFLTQCVIFNMPYFGELSRVLIILNIVNMLPIPPMDGVHISRSISFSRGLFTGYFVYCLCMLTSFWFLISFFSPIWALLIPLSFLDYRWLISPAPSRELSSFEQFIATLCYVVLFSVFLTLYVFTKDFVDSGAMTPFLFSQNKISP